MDSDTDLNIFPRTRLRPLATSTPESRHLLDIHKALIKYAIVSGRLFHIQTEEAWNSFHNTVENGRKYGDFSTRELCDLFVHELLPNIFQCIMPDKFRRKVKILDLNPSFKRTRNGYLLVKQTDEVNKTFEIKPELDFRIDELPKKEKHLSADEDNLKKPFSLDPKNSSSNDQLSHTVLLTNQLENKKTHSKFQFSPANAALLSAVFSNDHELSACALHDPERIYKNFVLAKQNFENNGRMTPFRSNADELFTEMKTFKKLKGEFINLLAKRYF